MRPFGIIAGLAVAGCAAFLALRHPTADTTACPIAEPDATVPRLAEFRHFDSARLVQPARPAPDARDGFAVPAGVSAEDDPEELAAARENWVNALPVGGIRRVLDSLPFTELGGDAAQLLVRRWAAAEPQAVAQWTEALAVTDARSGLQTAVALVWTETDPDGALAWADGLTDTRGEVLPHLGSELARDNPLRALEVAGSLPTTAGRDELILHALRQWGAMDAPAALAWLLEWPESELRGRAFADLAIAVADRDATMAAQIAATLADSGPQQDRAVIGVIQRWAQSDRDSTLAWVASFPATNLREEALLAIASVAHPPP